MHKFLPLPTILRAPEDGSGSSTADIMAAVLGPASEAAPEKKKQPQAATAAAPEGASSSDDAPEGATEETTDDTGDDIGDSPAGEGDDPSADGGTTDDEELFDPFQDGDTADTDDDSVKDEGDDAKTLTLTVDGNEVSVTLGELKRNFSLNRATQARLQEATEARTEARRVKEAAFAEQKNVETVVQTQREDLAKALHALKSIVTQPRVKAPDPALRSTDPQKYLLLRDAYTADQQACQQRAAHVDELLNGYQTARAESYQALRQEESQRLADRMPVFKDPVKGPKLLGMIRETAKSVGFNETDVNAVSDHRLFVLAAKAAMYDQLTSKNKKTVKVQAGQKTVVKAAGSGSVTKNPVRVTAGKQAQLVKTAKETGKVSDIARTLLVPAQR